MRSLVVIALAVASAAHAQTGDWTTSRRGPEWMAGWSPLARVADLTRTAPTAPRFADLLVAPVPRIGLFWTAGVPVGIGADIVQPRAELRAGLLGAGGEYRRSLDVDDVTAARISGLAWRPVGHGAVVGRVVALQRTTAAGHAAILNPHSSDPFVLADSSLPAMRQLSTRLEGALGWRFGRLDVGLSAGLDEHDFRTAEARFPRLGRASTPAVRAGIAIHLPMNLRFGLQGGWTGGSETVTLAAQPGAGEVYFLDGYSDPVPAPLSPGGSPGALQRRADRSATLAGGGLEGRVLGVRWVVHARRERRTDEYVSVRQATPPTDQWEASGWAIGGALQARALGNRVLLTADVRSRTLSGEARRAGLEGVFFRADEQVVDASVELRYQPERSSWRWTTAFALRRENRLRRDLIAQVHSDIRTWTAGGRIEVAREIGALTAGLGAAIAGYATRATIPDPDALGPLYQRLVAAENSLYAMPALPAALWVGASYRAGSGTLVALDVVGERLARRGAQPTLAFAPGGSYTGWSVDLRVVLDR